MELAQCLAHIITDRLDRSHAHSWVAPSTSNFLSRVKQSTGYEQLFTSKLCKHFALASEVRKIIISLRRIKPAHCRLSPDDLPSNLCDRFHITASVMAKAGANWEAGSLARIRAESDSRLRLAVRTRRTGCDVPSNHRCEQFWADAKQTMTRICASNTAIRSIANC